MQRRENPGVERSREMRLGQGSIIEGTVERGSIGWKGYVLYVVFWRGRSMVGHAWGRCRAKAHGRGRGRGRCEDAIKVERRFETM